MGHPAEGFLEVQEDSVNLVSLLDGGRPVMYCWCELGSGRKPLAEAMMCICEDVVRCKVLRNMAKDDMLHNLTAYAG